MEIIFFVFVAGLIFLWSQLRLNDLGDRLSIAERRIAELAKQLRKTPDLDLAIEPVVRNIVEVVGEPATVEEHLPPPLPPQLPVVEPVPQAVMAASERRSLEVTIGQSWLSKIGVVSLLIALSLLLINTLSSHGPYGKVLTAYGVSLALLGVGTWFERGTRPKALAWSLIGGGWAGIYFTTYAIHGLEPVRLIQSPTLAMVTLLGVALVMVLHSLRYESQTVTAVAFCAAFAAFEVAPLDLFSSIAGIPLLLFLLCISFKKNWDWLPVSGIVFAYVAASLNFHGADSVRYAYEWGQPVIWTYWLLIEAYDFLRYDAERPVFPINASGLMASTLLTSSWTDSMKPDHFIELASLAFLISAILRYRKQRALGPEKVEALSPGGFTACMIVSALLASMGIGRHFHGVWRVFAWTIHAEMLVLAGWQLRNRFLHGLGGILFLPATLQVLGNVSAEKVSVAGGSWREDIWVGSLLTGVLYANRFALGLWEPFSYAASVVVGYFLFQETSADFRPLAFTLATVVLAAAGRNWRRQELSFQAAGFTAVGLAVLLAATPATNYWLTIGAPAVIYAGAAWIVREDAIARQACISAANLFCAYLIHRVLRAPWIAAGWALQMMACWTVGIRGNLVMQRLQVIPLVLAVIVYMLEHESAVIHATVLRIFVLACFMAVGLLRPYLKDKYTFFIRPGALVIGIAMLTFLILDEVQPGSLTVSWAAEAAGLILLGIPVRDRIVRVAGLFVFALAIGRVLVYDLPVRDSTGRILTFVGLGVLLLGVSWAYTQFGNAIKAYLKEPESE